MKPQSNGLEVLLPAVSAWFCETFGTPTPPQAGGWPQIAAGRSTLIFAPTGSGKTLAAFLACLDHLWRNPIPGKKRPTRILYLSPLKALNADVHRNLQEPLAGILHAANARGEVLSELTVGVRTGDTPTNERQALIRNPPDILITTPESLHLMLTSKARETLRQVTHVIVDEIHALCPNKRGVFLALLLERLEHLNPQSFVRVGLSATQRPLEEVARYLGGLRKVTHPNGSTRLEARPVVIVDAKQRKELDLEVSIPFISSFPLPAASVWPAIEAQLRPLIAAHKSTIIFANNRRVVERLVAHLNIDENGEDRVVPIAMPHHGSLNLVERQRTEAKLKAGELPAVVSTASLELGIDMGAVDLVVQVESPGNIARGLQRVGRAGHVVGAASKGRLIAKTTGDLLETAALCRAMLHGEVEQLVVPTNCLDVLAQQVVACVATEPWEVSKLFDLVRQAYPYRDLPAEAFESVLKMVAGRFPSVSLRDLKPRLSWDRVHNRLLALPGTAHMALVGGGTIPDTGQFPLFLGEDGPRLGELDEEFVYERRVGESFRLGAATWKIEAIEAHKVVVSRAEGSEAMVPFWRGEAIARTQELGLEIATLTREISTRLDDVTLPTWLMTECCLNERAAHVLIDYVARQIRVGGIAPDDRTILIETFRDPAGELSLAILTPFGSRLHLGLKLVLQARLQQRLGITTSTLHGDDGVLIRIPATDSPPLDLFEGITGAIGEKLLRQVLSDSALFGLRFRQGAGRALLMPRPDPAKRTPLWLQRLRAKDLLQVVRKFPDFPIVVETYRECLTDDLNLPRLRQFLDQINTGEIKIVTRQAEIASPFTSELIFKFTPAFIYEWDEPRRGDLATSPSQVDADVLDPLLDPAIAARWLDPNAVGRVESRLRSVGQPPRTVDEMAETLRRLGDLTTTELVGPMAGFVTILESENRATAIELTGTKPSLRWILSEESDLYQSAFRKAPEEVSQKTIIDRFLRTHALIGLNEIIARYPIGPARATELLEASVEHGDLIRIDGEDGSRWGDRRNLDEVRRLSIALKRQESVAVPPEIFAASVANLQRVYPSQKREGAAAVSLVLEQLQGFSATAEVWETEILPRRICGYRTSWLDEAFAGGAWVWRGSTSGRTELRVAILARDFSGTWNRNPDEVEPSALAQRVLVCLREKGAQFPIDLARNSVLDPSSVRAGLLELAGLGQVTNDRFDPVRPGGEAMSLALEEAGRRQSRNSFRPRPAMRRAASTRPEGRWSVLELQSQVDPESSALVWAGLLLERYGVLTREIAELDPGCPPWKDLAPWLARAELRGELRRGYFVEGLSGVQYATEDSAAALAKLAGTPTQSSEPVLITSLDPANIYGSGAPLDVPLLEGGTARLNRAAGQYLVLVAGRPILIIEAQGKRLTGLGSASETELRAAVGLLPLLANPARKVIKVDTYNNSVASASAATLWLTEAGFVRDPPGMAFYAGWS